MPNSETLNVFKFNNRVLHLNLKDINHEESIISPINGAACINWVVGHIVLCRDEIHDLIGLPKFVKQIYYDLYDQGTNGNHIEKPIQLDEMIRLYDESQSTLEDSIYKLNLASDPKKLERLTFYGFHEAYHIGQIGILRRVIGKEGAIK